MRRRKFYTFISLFGISMTLTILIILTSFLDSALAPGYPEGNRSRTLYIQQLQELDRKNHGSWNNPVSKYFIEKYVFSLTSPEKVAMISTPNNVNTYINGQPSNLFFRYTDAHFWEITTFSFSEGKAFSAETLKNNDNAVIVTETFRDEHYGKDASVVGKSLRMANEIYRIEGVVRGCPIIQLYVSSDIYLPVTADKSPRSTNYGGNYFALLLAKSKADLPKIQAEFAALLPKVPILAHDGFQPDTLKANAETYISTFTSQLLDHDSDSKNSQTIFFTILAMFALCFMILPALNLVNVNISRIMERASEIGIRKAFGASTRTLTLQFIVENVIITVIGGLIALILSAFIIAYLNRNGLGIAQVSSLNLSINWLVASVALLMSLVFGLLSGVLPAFRMSKLSVVEALKT